jgi:uncharacterized OsmC-like protein
MYTTVVDNSPKIRVSTGRHVADFAVDGSLMNPLEAFYASLAACAAVYAKKACKGLGVDPAGITIACKPFAGPGGPLTLGRYRTEVRFPEGFPLAHRAAVLEAIGQCAVKEVVKAGAGIEFVVAEA